MSRQLARGVIGVALTTIMALGACRSHDREPTGEQIGSAGEARALPSRSGLDPIVDEFRATERTCLQRYNDALRAQRENKLDELELSNTIERDVLEPWRALRSRIASAPQTDPLYTTLRQYMEARQISWEAYVAALRAPSDEAARPHYDTHRLKNMEAQGYAKELGRMFREAALRANATP